MSDDDVIPSDQVVETALRLLPVPDHAPEFWSNLEERLVAEPAPDVVEPALATGPPLRSTPLRAAPSPVEPAAVAPDGLIADPARVLVPPALRRRSNVVLSAVAVAAAVVVVLAGSMLVQQRSGGGTGTEVAGAGGSSTSTSTTADPAAEPPAAAASTEAVLAFVGAMGSGDAQRAWDLLGPASRAHFGSRNGFSDQMGAGHGDYGTWAQSEPGDALVLAVPAAEGGEVLVVTLVGAVKRDAGTQRWAAAFPVRWVDGVARVEAYAFAGELELVVPGAAGPDGGLPVVPVDDALVVVVPRGVQAPMIRLDGGAPLVCGEADGTELVELRDAPGQRCSFRPSGDLEPGRHVLTVAFLSPDGAGIGARSVMFKAA